MNMFSRGGLQRNMIISLPLKVFMCITSCVSTATSTTVQYTLHDSGRPALALTLKETGYHQDIQLHSSFFSRKVRLRTLCSPVVSGKVLLL